MSQSQTHEAIATTLRRAASTLRDADVPFMLGGSLGCWARGGPRTQNDLDIMLPRQEIDRAVAALVGAGMRAEHPPEEWLFKVWDGDVMIDLIFESLGIGEVTHEMIAHAEQLPVLAIRMPVMSIEDILVGKLLAISEQRLDYTAPVEIARSLRERVDWRQVHERSDQSPYVRAFFALLNELDVVPLELPVARRPASGEPAGD